jgi:hypothetical protein
VKLAPVRLYFFDIVALFVALLLHGKFRNSVTRFQFASAPLVPQFRNFVDEIAAIHTRPALCETITREIVLPARCNELCPVSRQNPVHRSCKRMVIALAKLVVRDIVEEFFNEMRRSASGREDAIETAVTSG